MTSSTITGYIETILSYQWGYFWDETSSRAWTNAAGNTARYVSPAMFLGFAGGGAAFLLNLLGSLENSSQTITEVEGSLDTWIAGYVDGNYVDIIDDIKTSAKMQQLLLAFTIDLITYTISSFIHSLLLLFYGFAGAMYIFFQMNNYYTANGWDADIYYGFRGLLMGALLGSIGYFGGNITKNTMNTVMLSLGFLDHEAVPAGNESISMTDGTLTNSIAAETEDISYDYKKFILMQENWQEFFLIQRGMQLIAPYLLQFVVDVAEAGVLVLLFMYV